MKVNEHYSQKSAGIEGTEVGHNRLDPNRNVIGNVTGFKMQQGSSSVCYLFFEVRAGL
jgi:glucosylceramidase